MIEPPDGLSPEQRGEFLLDQYRHADAHARWLMAYWGELVTRPDAIVVQPGSELDRHNEFTGISEHLEVPRQAWRALATAGEHMSYATYWSHATEGGVTGTPERTLARTMLLGCARALFLLEPDDQVTRQVRAAQIANQEVHDAERFLKSARGADRGDLFRKLEAETLHLSEAAGSILTDAGRSADSKITETNMLTTVAPLLADGLDDPVASVMSLWSRTSGVAHARSWTWDLWDRIHPAVTAANTWSIVAALGHKAWMLWNQRRGGEDPPALPPEDWEPDFSTMLRPHEDYDEAPQLAPWMGQSTSE